MKKNETTIYYANYRSFFTKFDISKLLTCLSRENRNSYQNMLKKQTISLKIVKKDQIVGFFV